MCAGSRRHSLMRVGGMVPTVGPPLSRLLTAMTPPTTSKTATVAAMICCWRVTWRNIGQHYLHGPCPFRRRRACGGGSSRRLPHTLTKRREDADGEAYFPWTLAPMPLPMPLPCENKVGVAVGDDVVLVSLAEESAASSCLVALEWVAP